jgi:parvulin-like peptidyl-prolyl isomerase
MALKKSIVKSKKSYPYKPFFTKRGLGGDLWNINIKKFLLFTFYFLLFTFLCGCASFQREKILAVVDGEPITEGDLKYSLNISHRKEDLSSAGELNLPQYVQKLVDDRLITDDARRSGMDQYPEVKEAVQAYILRESVVRLYDEEIAQKVSVTEKDVEDYYKKNYELFTLGLIEVQSEEEAGKILERFRKGENFEELARKYSIHPSKKDGGRVVITRNSLSTYIYEAVSQLKPEEISDVIKIMNKYYIARLINRKEAPDEELDKMRGKIEGHIRKQKEKERSDEYLGYLREHANIKIDQKLLSSIKEDIAGVEMEKLLKDTRPLAEVNGTVLTVGDFVTMITPSTRKSSEDVLNNWIDRKVVDYEALRRHYENNADLKEMIYRYENKLLLRAFIKNIIVPGITISDNTLEEYYNEHQKSFINPARFRVQQITVKSMDEAQDVLDNLKNGADFSWLAKRKSTDPAGSNGGDIGWVTKMDLPEPLRDVLDTLNVGDISPITKIDSLYRIIRLQGKTEEKVKEFNEVKNDVYRACFNEQLNSLLDKYVAQLKEGAKIKIYDEEIQALGKKLL